MVKTILNNIWSILSVIGLSTMFIFNWILRRKVKEKNRTIEELEKAKEVYEAKERIRDNDIRKEEDVKKKIENIEEELKVKTGKEKAETVGKLLDDYFNEK